MSAQELLQTLMESYGQQVFHAAYCRTFDITRADTDELRKEAFSLRYQIYCVENNFEGQNADEIERDAYDDRAVHYLLVHKKSGDVAGTVRVLLPDEEKPSTCFAMQELCDHPILQANGKVPSLCQISRLCMSSRFRRRAMDGKLLPAYYEQEVRRETGSGKLIYLRRSIPYAPLGLFQAAFDTALQARVMDCVCMMEPGQLQNFKRMGILYRVMGPRISYHGCQQPVIFNIKNVLDNMLTENQQCWDVASDMGRLHKKANKLHQDEWQDRIFDENCRDKIYDKLL